MTAPMTHGTRITPEQLRHYAQNGIQLRPETIIELADQIEELEKYEPQNPCNCVPDGDDGTVAHLCWWHKEHIAALTAQQEPVALKAKTLLVEGISYQQAKDMVDAVFESCIWHRRKTYPSEEIKAEYFDVATAPPSGVREKLPQTHVMVPVAELEVLEAAARAGQVNAKSNCPNLEGDFAAIRNRIAMLRAAQEGKS